MLYLRGSHVVENIKKINIIDSLNKLHTNLNCLKNNIIYLTIHGSLAYGTATPESDLDIRGIFIPPKKYFLGALDRCEQAEFKEPHDIVIFELRKFVHLALDNNPNVIGCYDSNRRRNFLFWQTI